MSEGARRLLVLTTVHHADDTRIREKTISCLTGSFSIDYATRLPAPTNPVGFNWIPLRGGRIRRNVRAWLVALGGRYQLLSIHDPELLPLAVVAGSRAVFDVHEDLPAQFSTKTWLPRPLRRPLATISILLLKWVHRRGTVTLAEPSYQRLLTHPAPVVPNYPMPGALPSLGEGDEMPPRAIYVGDVTEARGIEDAVVACGQAGVPLDVIGSCGAGFAARLCSLAAQHACDLDLHGRLPNRQAMLRVRDAAVALSPLRDLPNYAQSLPTKVLEYLAMGTPVVATDLPATRVAIEGYRAVRIVPPGDPAAMGRAVRELVVGQAKHDARQQAEAVRRDFAFPSEVLRDVYLSAGRHRAGSPRPN